jgi:sulfate-transporting ATPase
LPLRDHLLQRLPAAGSGNIKLWRVVVLTVVGCVIADQVPQLWSSAIAQSMAGALILLSIVLLTGYAGQISLAQVALAGFGAWIAARMAADQGAPFLLALIIGIAATVPLAVLFGLTAIRTRGPNLAIATLGLGAAIEYIILDNTNLTGGVFGLTVPTPELFGYSIDPIAHSSRYAIVCIVAFAIAAVAVANLRRGRTGRRMLGVRENERAAAALGISVPGTKIYAFAVSTAIAATGGVLIAFQNPVVSFTSFTSTMSISFVGFAVIGGVGYISGAIAGSTLVVGGVGTQLGNEIFNANSSGGFSQYLPIISGVSLLAILMQDPDGIAAINIKQAKFLAAKARARGVRLPSWAHLPQRHAEPDTQPESIATGFGELRKPSISLEVKNLIVRYGGVTAVDDFSVLVEPGKVVGLIGPNGAGKTSVIDALTGFTPHASGHTTLGGVGIEQLPAHRRARMGLSRSFQSLELFDDLTVAENLMTASDRRDYRANITDFVHPAGQSFPPVVAAVIEEFRLADVLDQRAGDLSHGERRLVAIARAIALEPAVILLDEPAAGLTAWPYC